MKATRRAPGSKKPKDPNAPKAALSSYFLFSNERRSLLMQQHKDQKITEISKIISGEWKELSEEAKGVYQQLSKDAKVEFKLKFDEYKKTDNYATHCAKVRLWEQKQKNAGNDGGKPMKKISMPRKPKDGNAPKKAVSSYFLFAQGVRDEVRAENPELKVTQIAKIIGQKWGLLSDDEKAPFATESARLKEEYKIKFAVYVESAEAKEYQERLEKWKLECDKRTRAYDAKMSKARAKELEKQKAEKAKAKSKGKGKGKKGKKGKKTKQKMRVDESSDSESESESESSTDSDSNSGSSSESSSSSDDSSSSESD